MNDIVGNLKCGKELVYSCGRRSEQHGRVRRIASLIEPLMLKQETLYEDEQAWSQLVVV